LEVWKVNFFYIIYNINRTLLLSDENKCREKTSHNKIVKSLCGTIWTYLNVMFQDGGDGAAGEEGKDLLQSGGSPEHGPTSPTSVEGEGGEKTTKSKLSGMLEKVRLPSNPFKKNKVNFYDFYYSPVYKIII
jgi:hypothetical protein